MAIAAITIDLNAKIANFETELKRATSSLDRFEKKGNQVAAGFKTALGSLGAAVSVGAIAAFAKSGIDAADALQDMSDRLGVSVKDLASFKLAAQLADTSLDGVGNGISRLSRSIGEAEAGNKKLAETLQTLGITARDPKEAFFQLADATKRIQDPSQRAALLSQVLGKSYQELVPLLNQGGEALRQSARESESFADAMARLAPEAGKFNDQLDILKNNAAAAAAEGLLPLVEALNRTVDRFEALGRLRGAGASLFDVVTGGISADYKKSLDRVNADIADLEAKRKSLGTVRLSQADQSELARLKAIRTELQLIAVESINAPPGSASSGRPALPAPRGIDLSAATGDKKSKTPSAPSIIDVFDNGSYITRSKETAEAIREQQSAINDLTGLMAGDAVRATEAFDTRLAALISDTRIAKTQELEKNFGVLSQALFEGKISAEQHAEAMTNLFERIAPEVDRVKTLAEELGEAFTGTFKNAGADILNLGDLLDTLQQRVVSVFANSAGNYAANLIGNFAASMFAFEGGGIMTGSGPLPLNAYSGGGIANSPQLAVFGEGSVPEAFVPVPNGRIPVELRGGAGGSGAPPVIINYNIDARGSDAGVEQRIRRALDETEARSVSRSVALVQSMNQRGQLRLA